jgi:ferrous iron transport protein B
MTPLQGYAFLVFNLLCAPCFAAIGAIKREMNNGKWTVFAIAYQCVFAYIVSLIIYQVGSAIQGNLHAVGFVVALILIAMLIFLLVRPYNDSTKGSTLSVEKAMK